MHLVSRFFFRKHVLSSNLYKFLFPKGDSNLNLFKMVNIKNTKCQNHNIFIQRWCLS